jgi:phytoene dehydrogenase-like protein
VSGRPRHDAVVVGAGHNGLVAANVLADAGWSVLVVEAEDEPGGSVRSGELVEPGFVNDRCAAFFPLAAASPVFAALGLEIPFRHGPLVLAHPALDGSCATLRRDGGPPEWRLAEPAMLRALVRRVADPRLLGALPLLKRPADPLEARIRLGNALHTDAPPWSLLGRAFGLVLTMLGRTHGFPCVEGGAGRITDLLVGRALARGVELRLGERADRVPAARRAVIAAVDVWELGRLTGRAARRRPDPATVKVDWTLDGPVPWTAEPPRRAPVVHLGGPADFVLFGHYSPADPTRAPAGKETAWAYSHALDADAIEEQVERYAPGFRALVRGRRVERLPPGRINGGRTALRLAGPRVGDGLYLGSLSAYPGGGVHGAPGYRAAQAALRSAARRRARGVWSFTSSSSTTT